MPRNKEDRARYMREYYRAHPEHAEKVRERARRRYAELRQDPLSVEKERARGRKRAARDYQEGRRKLPPEKAEQYNRAWRQRYPERAKAQAAVKRALKRGTLRVARHCEWSTGCSAYSLLQAHHEDYSKPLVVLWLCPPHHGLTRRKDKAAC